MKRFLQRENTRMYHVWLRSFMVCLCLALAGVSAWGQDGTYTFNGGTGVKDDPYLISTVTDLKNMAEAVNQGTSSNTYNKKHYKLTTNLTLSPDDVASWEPIGPVHFAFSGSFDGGGNIISGFDVSHTITEQNKPFGFFGTISENAIIKNLKVCGNINIVMDDNASSCIVGGICGRSEGLIEKCVYGGEIKVSSNVEKETGENAVGGICGRLDTGGKIKGCSNESGINVELDKYRVNSLLGFNSGGVVGIIIGASCIEDCFNTGCIILNIENNEIISACVGGIIGYSVSQYDDTPSISNCYNEGKITVKGANNDMYCVLVGGVLGQGPLTGGCCYNIEDIEVEDIVVGGSLSIFTGGVVGSLSGNPVKIENCYNYGKINTAGGNVIKGNTFAAFTQVEVTSNKCYYLKENDIENAYDIDKAEGIINSDFNAGKVAWLLRDAGFGQNLNGSPSDEYPKLQSLDDVPAVYKLTLKKEGDNSYPKEQYCNSGNLNLPEVPENFGWFDSEGKEYFNNSEITNDLELTIIEKKKYTVTVKVAEGCEDMGTVTGSDQYDKGTEVTITATPKEGYEFKSWTVESENVTLVDASQATTTFTMPENDVTVTATFTEKEDPTDPEEPVDPPVVDPTNYYNIYNETTYDFIDVSFSRNVVREGGSINVYLGIPEGLDPAAVTLMFKRSLYGGWENLNTDDDGNYLINNIWTDIYVKAVVDESYIDPEPDENHIYIDLSETNDSIWLYTDHKLVEEGKTAVIQAEVAKSCQNKEIRYMYKRTVLGEWKEMPKDYSINQYVVRDITTDIYVKAYFVFDKQDPTTAKNPHHVYADITATCEGLYLDATRHKVADEGDTKVFLYVKKGFETKDARYLFKRGLKGEWEDLVPGIEQNTFQVTGIEGDIYLKGIDAVYTGTEDIDGMVRVYTKDGSLFVYTAQPEEISVVSMTGVTVKRTRQTGLQSYPLNQGIYVICVGEQVFKVRVK